MLLRTTVAAVTNDPIRRRASVRYSAITDEPRERRASATYDEPATVEERADVNSCDVRQFYI